MRSTRWLALLLVIVTAAPAAAQNAVTVNRGTTALGVLAGIVFPVDKESQVATGPMVAGLVETYVTAKMSIRGQVAWAPRAYFPSDTTSLNQVWVAGSLAYHVEEG